MVNLFKLLETIESTFTYHELFQVIENDTFTVSRLDPIYFGVFRKVDDTDSEIIDVMTASQVEKYMEAWYANT